VVTLARRKELVNNSFFKLFLSSFFSSNIASATSLQNQSYISFNKYFAVADRGGAKKYTGNESSF